ncbi:hypothetical protein [Pseudobacteriovorax antillogorgiicola]|uniref:Uncharacterized protein n=1 Tax=Pseudobacteriovorax antillogorgiicola TaxID=1513793 RepID=A0A1Y6CPK7_9BACT|nr:hypothetical protein [Pseudobacteriovorax antillogorgiicola]TCS44396.1 hypothetical protein EDD56_13323 [Pseudobacteriovorax antillogorgiicola]SMF79291.1 hypothetical protein SAMN06296036_13351 [Pseudobacteriovorax antillogorgiicola]
MFLDWLNFINEDFRTALGNLEPKDFAYPSYTLLWLIILFFPLAGIDRQDPIAGMVYILYCLGAGATLLFALPNNFDKLSDFSIHLTSLILMGLVAGYRWFHRNNQTMTRDEHEENVAKKGTK